MEVFVGWVAGQYVAGYPWHILAKLHLANRTQAALYAVRSGLAKAKGMK